ncbi:MAG: RHS repeat-associated core domain-containing protein [Bacteriovoracia bacterium]
MFNQYVYILMLASFVSSAWGRPDFLREKYLEVEIIESPQEVIELDTTHIIKGYLCLKHNIGHSNNCRMLAPEDLSKYEIKFTYPHATSDITQNVQIIEEENRFRFEASLPALTPGIQSPRFGAYLFQKGHTGHGLHVAYQKILAHIERFEQLKDKLHWKGKNSYEKHLKHLRSIAQKLQKKIHAQDARWAERSIPLQLKNFVAAPSSWMVSTASWSIEAEAQLGTGFKGEKSWLDLAFNPYDDVDDEWKVEVKQNDQLIFEQTGFKSDLHQRILLSGDFVGESEAEIKIWGKNAKKGKWHWESVFKRDLKIFRIEDLVAPTYKSFLPLPGRYVGRDVPTFSLVLEDLKGRMDRLTVDGDLVEDGGNRVSLKNTFSFETSQNTLVADIHGSQNGSDLFSITGMPQGVPEGFYNLQMLVKDFAGNQAPEASWRFIVDRTPPIIAYPNVPSIKSNDESYELEINVTDATDVLIQVFHNGVFVGETTQKIDGMAIDLVDGANFVRLTAIDEAGNMSELNYPPIFLDNLPPEIEDINIEDGLLIRTASFNIQGSAIEELGSILVNGQEVDFESTGTTFSFDISLYAEGEQTLTLELFDLAGNSITYEYQIDFLLRLVDGALIRVEKINEDQMKIMGFPGATGPNFPLEIDAGWFNSTELTANDDGSFEVILDAFDEAIVTATYPLNGRQESALAKFKFDTTLAGVVKDKDDNPLPGVTVTIQSSEQETVTDEAGRFYISDPALGDQTLIIDGTTIPVEVTQGTREFSQIAYNVSLGSRQQNILERPIYLSPKMLDGTETIITNGASVSVSSSHAPGVSLEVPAGAAVFPGGGNSGSINIIEIPGSRTSIEVPDEAIPDTVFALEPSGLEFKERVHLTLPNPNEFPEGTELVILSRNSESGYWEIDGSATVTGPDMIETKPGQGISHFSEVFAAPLGMEIKKFADGDKPRIDTLDGAVSTQISLPSFKVLGQDITPSLTYNSNWAYPNVLVTNVFDLPRKYFDVREKDMVASPGVVRSDIRIRTWITPEWIDARFVAGNINSGNMRYKGLPDQAVVSSQHDLSTLSSGIIPTNSSYEIRFKHLTLVTGKVKVRNSYSTSTQKIKPIRQVTWESVFPPDLQAPVYLQNKKESPYGEGWQLNFTKTILNPGSDRVLVENENGGVAVYAIKNVVQNLAYDEKGIEAFGSDGGNVYFVNSENNLFQYSDGATNLINPLPRYSGQVGINASWYHGYSRNCVKSGWSGCRKYEYTYRYTCEKYNAPFDTGRTTQSLSVKNGSVHLLDGLGAVFESSSELPIAGQMGLPANLKTATKASSGPSIVSHCTNVTGEACSTVKENRSFYVVRIKSRPKNQVGYCNTATCYSGTCSPRTWLTGSGAVPQIGFSDGPLSSAKFNKPYDFVSGNREGTFYVTDYGNNIVRFVDTVLGQVSTVAGNRSTTDSGDGGFATSASMYHPRGVAVDLDGSFYVSTEKGYIRKVGVDGRITTFAGKPTTAGGVLADTTDFESMALKNPSGLVLDKVNQFLYVADTGHNRIMRLNLNTKLAQVVAGNGTCVVGDTQEGKVGLEISLCGPERIALDGNNNLLILDKVNKRIRRVNFTSPEDGLLNFQPFAKDNTMLYKNQAGEFVLSYRDGSQTLFNKDGQQIETSDRTGRVHRFSYNEDKQLTKVRFPTNQELELEYAGGRLSQIIDPAGRITQFVNEDGRIGQVIYPDNSVREFNYQEDGILTEEKDQLGYATSYELNNFKRLKVIHRPDNTTIQISDALSQSLHQGEDAGEQELKSFKGELNKLQDIIRDAKGYETSFSRDTNGYVDTITDSQGRVTKVERDTEGRPTKIINFDETFSTMAYNSFGDLVQHYNSSSNSSESFEYNSSGSLIKYTNSMGQVRTAIYDSETGLLIEERDYLGQISRKTYNTFGLVASQTNPNNETSQFNYNEYGNLVQVTSPKNESVQFSRDASGNIISKTDSNNHSVNYSFDLLNRILSVQTAKNLTTSYKYSLRGDLVEIIDPANNKTQFFYDSMGRTSKKISPLGQVYQLSYDENGNVAQEIDPIGSLKSFSYDASNRLIKKILPDDIYEYTFNEKGQMIFSKNNSSTIALSFTEILGSEKVASILIGGPQAVALESVHVYDVLGRRTELQTSVGTWTTYYDANGRVSTINGAFGDNYLMGFDSVNRLKNISRPGGVQSLISFDAASAVTQILHKRSDALLNGFNYQQDGSGNRTQIDSMLGTTVLTYDQDDQLTGVNAPYGEESFQYDELGNRVIDSDGVFSFEQKKYRMIEDMGFIYGYDANGNLITKQSKGLNGAVYNFKYTSENQLKSIQIFEAAELKKELHFYYDVLGRRIKKQVIDHNEAQKSFTHKFAYDGQDVIAVFNENDELMARYTHSGMRMDDVLGVEVTNAGVDGGMANSSGKFYFLKDVMGTITDIIDAAGVVVQRYSYSAFGRLLKTMGADGMELASPIIKTHYAFTGRELDEESGLYYYRARYYDAHSGRFMQEDPHSGDIRNPITVTNRYVYGGNNPVMNVDPNGRFFFAAIIIGAVLGGVIADANGGNFLEGALIGAAAGGVGAFVGGAVGLGVGNAVSGAIGGTAGSFFGGVAAFGAGAFVGGSVGGLAGGVVGAGIGAVNGRGAEEGLFYGLGLGFSVGAITGGLAGLGSYAYGDFLFNDVDFGIDAFGIKTNSIQRYIYNEAYGTASGLSKILKGPNGTEYLPVF